MKKNNGKKIVIVGGGAGGLELAAKLCNKFKNNETVEITLIDKYLKHVWKPLYHEVAAGTFTYYKEEIDYISYAYQKGFKFVLGKIKEINRTDKLITIAPYYQDDKLILPGRQLTYDILVLAVGSKINDFNIPGVNEHCLLLDSLGESEKCNQVLLKNILLCTQNNTKKINISVVGGGATGVELAAELNHALMETMKYGKKQEKHTSHFQISVIEAGKRLLSNLPVRISQAVLHYLQLKNIKVLTDTKITQITSKGLFSDEGKFIGSDMIIWATGVKGNTDAIKHDLEVNKINQFIVTTTLQTSKDESIFAFGDCASCPQIGKDGKVTFVPPRAQAAHQQASLLYKSLSCYISNKKLPHFHYRDYGSLISLSHYNVVGNLMTNIAKSLYVEGIFARLTYWFLYKKHLVTLKGIKYVILNTISSFFIRRQKPTIKLH